MIDLDEPALRANLAACLNVQRWIDGIVERAPYDSLAVLLSVARTAADPLTVEEVSRALAQHPRIGDRPTGSGVEADFSRREQSSADAEDQELAAAMAEGNTAYEARFGRVFLIRAAGRSRKDILAELQRRLRLSEQEELTVVGEQLREIALLRAEDLFGQYRTNP